MFRSSKRQVFRPTAYGAHSRTRRRVPRWLVLMLTGVVLGAGGVLFLQQSYGPKRLTVEQSEQLHYDLNSANMDKQRLQATLNQQTRELQELRQRLEVAEKESQAAQSSTQTLRDDIQRFADAMPDDPRGTSPGIHAATFTADEGALNYSILIMQKKDETETFTGRVQLTVAGRYANRRNGQVDLPEFGIQLQRYTHADGALELPEGFTPRQVTIKVMREDSDAVVATRIINVRQ